MFNMEASPIYRIDLLESVRRGELVPATEAPTTAQRQQDLVLAAKAFEFSYSKYH